MSNRLGPEVGYVDILVHGMEERAKEEAETPRKYTPLRPSAAGKCTRELYHELMSYSGKEFTPVEPMKAETKLLLDLGGYVEDHLVKQFRYIMRDWEVRMPYGQQTLGFKELNQTEDEALHQWLEGKLDLTFISKDWKCVADIKSKKDKFSAYYKTGWDEYTQKLENMESVVSISERAFWVEDLEAFLDELDDVFFEANFLQLNMYANSNFLKSRGVDHAAIIQYNKNDSRLREVRFKPSEAVYERTVAKFEAAQQAADKNDKELAKKDFTLGSMKCAFCDYKEKCWPGHDSLKEWFATLPPKRWPAKASRLKEGIKQPLLDAFSAYVKADAASTKKKKHERDIVNMMRENKLWSLELDDGKVYRLRELKSEGWVIRRSKK